MKLTIKGTPEEIKNVLQAISGSKEHVNYNVSISSGTEGMNCVMSADEIYRKLQSLFDERAELVIQPCS